MWSKFSILLIVFLFLAGCCAPQKRNWEDSFLLVRVTSAAIACPIGEDSCKLSSEGFVGSGWSIASDGETSIIATAGHVCVPNAVLRTIIVFDNAGKTYDSTVIKIDEKLDTCLLKIRGNIPPLVISLVSPKVREHYVAMSAPHGMWSPGIVPVFEGLFCGKDKSAACFTMFSTQGSSGGPILDRNGEVVGMVLAVPKDFNAITVSCTYEALVNLSETAYLSLSEKKK